MQKDGTRFANEILPGNVVCHELFFVALCGIVGSVEHE
jgi:hypothetical protein